MNKICIHEHFLKSYEQNLNLMNEFVIQWTNFECEEHFLKTMNKKESNEDFLVRWTFFKSDEQKIEFGEHFLDCWTFFYMVEHF